MKHHRHRIIGMMQHADFIEAVPVVKSHRIGIGWNQAHLRGDWTVGRRQGDGLFTARERSQAG